VFGGKLAGAGIPTDPLRGMSDAVDRQRVPAPKATALTFSVFSQSFLAVVVSRCSRGPARNRLAIVQSDEKR